MIMQKHNSTQNQFISGFSTERKLMSDELIVLISEALNTIHNTSYSLRFWRVLIMPYISAVISSKQYLENNELRIKPTTDVIGNSLKPEKHIVLYSKIRYYIKALKSFGSLNKLKKQLRTKEKIAFGFHYPEAIIPEMDAYLNAYYPLLLPKSIDKEKRNITISETGKFSYTFVKNVIGLIPMLYIEYFESILRTIPVYEPKKKSFHISMQESAFMNFLIAKYIENGAKLYCYQHGGFYGEYEFHGGHYHETQISDNFMTWGWKIHEKDVPSKAYRLEKFRNSYKIINNASIDILIVYPSILKRNIDHYCTTSKAFFEKIDRSIYPVIFARPRPTSKFNRKSSLNFIKKNVDKIDSGYVNISKLISNSRLVIQMTYPSTNMLECFYVDHPCIALFNNDTPSKIVKPYYEFLLKEGILHYSVESLVKHLNNIDLFTWWQSIITQPTYIAFKNEFLRKV